MWLDYILNNNVLPVFNLLNCIQISEQILVSQHIIFCLQFLEDEVVILSFIMSQWDLTLIHCKQETDIHLNGKHLVGSYFQCFGLQTFYISSSTKIPGKYALTKSLKIFHYPFSLLRHKNSYITYFMFLDEII